MFWILGHQHRPRFSRFTRLNYYILLYIVYCYFANFFLLGHTFLLIVSNYIVITCILPQDPLTLSPAGLKFTGPYCFYWQELSIRVCIFFPQFEVAASRRTFIFMFKQLSSLHSCGKKIQWNAFPVHSTKVPKNHTQPLQNVGHLSKLWYQTLLWLWRLTHTCISGTSLMISMIVSKI